MIIFLLETLNVTSTQALYDVSVQRALNEDEEAATRMSEQVHSSWPIGIEVIDENADKQRIQNLIRKTDRIEL